MKTPFTPHRLPVDTLILEPLIHLIGNANRAVGTFDSLMQSIPNARVLLSPLTTNEAVLSSKIEGTHATLQEVLRFEADPKQQTEKYDDIREIINYRRAMDSAIDALSRLPLTERLIRKTHKILLTGVRGAGKDPGNFRKGEVYIGGVGLRRENADYIPPPYSDIPRHFSNLEQYIHSDAPDPLIQLAIVHAQFEIIHPFWDGNGRTGRILMPLFLYYKRVLSTPMFYLSEYFEINRDEYFQRLLNISAKNDWEGWIKFFLTAVTEQSEKNIQKIKQILDLYKTLKEHIIDIPTPKHAIKVLDFLFACPFFDSPRFMRDTAIEKAAAFRILKFLKDNGIISDNDRKRDKTYFFDDLMRILTSLKSR